MRLTGPRKPGCEVFPAARSDGFLVGEPSPGDVRALKGLGQLVCPFAGPGEDSDRFRGQPLAKPAADLGHTRSDLNFDRWVSCEPRRGPSEQASSASALLFAPVHVVADLSEHAVGVAAYPPYAEYQERAADRVIPVFVAEPVA